MIAFLDPRCPPRLKAEVVRFVERAGFRAQLGKSAGRATIGVIGAGSENLAGPLAALAGVTEVRSGEPPWPLVSRERHPESTRVRVRDVAIGNGEPVVIAGPCAVESRAQLRRVADILDKEGVRLLRGGAFKPRTSPYSFQGLGEEGLDMLAEIRETHGVGIVTEVVAPDEVDLVARRADMLQIGARNMQNFRLLQAAGAQPRPVLLKRGLMATLEELLLAAEYVVAAGNPSVVLCERGIRTFERSTRNTLDVGALPVLRELTHLPVIVDPSHAAGRREWVPALALASVAAGADGLLVEVHPEPGQALCDGRQSLTPGAFSRMMADVRRVGRAVRAGGIDAGRRQRGRARARPRSRG